MDRVSARSRGSCQSNRPWVHPPTAYMWTHIQAQPLKGEVTEACFIHSLIHSTSMHWASPGTAFKPMTKKEVSTPRGFTPSRHLARAGQKATEVATQS